MSHKFHGKGSGKKKTEKRMKRVWDEFVSASVGEGGGGGVMLPVQRPDGFTTLSGVNVGV